MADGEITWHSYQSRNCLVLTPAGELDIRTYRMFRNSLVKYAMDQPTALIVIVGRLRITSVSSLSAFTSAWMRISEWPGVPILLVARDPDQRAALAGSVTRCMAVHGSLHAAMMGLRDPPVRRRSEIDLVAVAASSRIARSFVQTTCADWDVADRIPDAIEVATELVENSIIHAGTDLRLRLELHNDRLAIAVHDASPHEAVLRERDRGPGSGLRLVAELATAWGCAPDTEGGKIVWAVLTARHP